MQSILSQWLLSINFLFSLICIMFVSCFSSVLHCYNSDSTLLQWSSAWKAFVGCPIRVSIGPCPTDVPRPLCTLLSLLLTVILWNTFAYTICDSNIIAASSESTKETTCGDSQATLLDPTAIPIQGKHQWGKTAVTSQLYVRLPDSCVLVFCLHFLCLYHIVTSVWSRQNQVSHFYLTLRLN